MESPAVESGAAALGKAESRKSSKRSFDPAQNAPVPTTQMPSTNDPGPDRTRAASPEEELPGVVSNSGGLFLDEGSPSELSPSSSVADVKRESVIQPIASKSRDMTSMAVTHSVSVSKASGAGSQSTKMWKKLNMAVKMESALNGTKQSSSQRKIVAEDLGVSENLASSTSMGAFHKESKLSKGLSSAKTNNFSIGEGNEDQTRPGLRPSLSMSASHNDGGNDSWLRNDVDALQLRDTEYVDKWEIAMGFDIFENVFRCDHFLLPRGVWSFVFSPSAMLTEALMACIAVWTVIFTPLALVFAMDQSLYEIFGGWCWVDLALDVVFGIGLLLRLRISILEQKTEIRNPGAIQSHRLRNPKYLLSWISCIAHIFLLSGASTWLIAPKMIRVLELVWVSDTLWLAVHRSRRLKLILLCFAPSLLSHLLACIWMPASGYLDVYHHVKAKEVNAMSTVYLTALCEGVYMTLGVGVDVFESRNLWGTVAPRPVDSHFALCLLVVMGVIGSILTAVIFSGLVLLLNQSYLLAMRHQEVITCVDEALDTLSLPGQLRTRVRKFSEFQRYSHDRMALGMLFSKDSVNQSLDAEMRIALYYPMVQAANIFSSCEINFILEVVKRLTEEMTMPGDYLCRIGDISREMFFLVRGEVAILSSESALLRILERGHFFGELALLEDQKRSAFARCNTYCVVLKLMREAVTELLCHFPDEEQVIRDKVESLARGRAPDDDEEEEDQSKTDTHDDGMEDHDITRSTRGTIGGSIPLEAIDEKRSWRQSLHSENSLATDESHPDDIPQASIRVSQTDLVSDASDTKRLSLADTKRLSLDHEKAAEDQQFSNVTHMASLRTEDSNNLSPSLSPTVSAKSLSIPLAGEAATQPRSRATCLQSWVDRQQIPELSMMLRKLEPRHRTKFAAALSLAGLATDGDDDGWLLNAVAGAAGSQRGSLKGSEKVSSENTRASTMRIFMTENTEDPESPRLNGSKTEEVVV